MGYFITLYALKRHKNKTKTGTIMRTVKQIKMLLLSFQKVKDFFNK